MKIKSFGCSFIFGNELSDDGRDGNYATPSQLTWPALIAKNIGAEYQCYAKPGSGNLKILEQIMHQAGLYEPDVFYIIGWTWIERFDYISAGTEQNQWKEQWATVTPICISSEAKNYYRYFHTELKDKIQSLIYISTAVDLLRRKKIPFVMTCIDDLIWNRTWHAPVSVTDTQDYVRPFISDFQAQNFLDWSRQQGFPIGQWLHPLEQAHASAADLMLPLCKKRITDLESCPLSI